MKKLFPIVATMLVFALSGCAPQVDVEAEADAIRNLDAELLKAAETKDIERLVVFFADDATWFPPNASIIEGKVAFREFAAAILQSPDFTVSHEVGNVEVSHSRDLVYYTYTYTLTLNDPSGKPVTDSGKGIYLLKKQPDGSWKAVVDIWNSDGPPASE